MDTWVLVRPHGPVVRGKKGDVPLGHAEQKTWPTKQSAKAAERRLAKQGETYWAMREETARRWEWDADLPF